MVAVTVTAPTEPRNGGSLHAGLVGALVMCLDDVLLMYLNDAL